ncbi:MAG: peptide/nickel transport system substrate-binding protein [Frankiaceae bacterium]|nr:peptide/nickel transport system substrate-binding protein [Frankiaceae bacterium]
MRINRAVATSVASVLALGGLAACSSSTSASPAASSSTSGSTSPSGTTSASSTTAVASGVLKVGMPNGQQTENFNPFLGSSAGASLGFRAMIYEPLIMMNPIDPSKPGKPWLATDATWSNNFQQVVFTIRDNAKWTDGQPVTAADVAFTFNLIKANPSINGNNLPFDTITATGNKVTVTFKASQFVNQTKVVTTIVVPEHIWKTAGDPGKFENKNPVGSGPYTLTSFTPQTTTLDLRKDGGYWQALPQVAQLLYTSYADNNAQTTALANGEADWSFVFIPDVEKVYTSKDPAHNKLWFPPNLGAHGLWINTDKTHAPFDDATLRKAMNMVINRDDIFQIGEAGYFYPAVTNITGIPTPAGAPFISADYKDQNLTVDVAGAKKLLTDAGYKYSGTTLQDKTGKAVSLTLTDPAGWSDYQTDLSIIADNLKQIGITAKIEKANQDAWFTKIDTGNFDAAMHWTNGGATPYDLYENIMNGDIMKPIGKPGSGGNYGRFQSAEATAAIKSYATAADETTRTAALATIEKIFVDNVPVLITSAANVGAEYSTAHWTGWPDETNPWTAPQPTQQNALEIVLALKPAS